MVSIKNVRRLLADVESNYLKCWDILETLKAAPDISLLDFQPTLCDAMLRLAYTNSEINKARRTLLQRQPLVSKNWLKVRLKSLDAHQEAIGHAVGIGKALGDAFAWFFYHNDRTLLSEHIKHSAQKYLPIGLGGVGELEFIKGVKAIDGKRLYRKVKQEPAS